MLAHDQNLRMAELVDLFRKCGVGNVQDWLPKHPAVRKFFSDQGRQSDKVDAELKNLVTYRNDAAHGGVEVDQLVGREILVEYADFLAALFHALAECAQSAVIQKLIQQEKVWLVGKVTEVYSDNIVVAIVEKATFSVNDFVYLRGDAYCRRARIVSLQDDGNAIQKKTVLSASELGLKFDVKPSKAAEIFLAIPEPSAEPVVDEHQMKAGELQIGEVAGEQA